MKNNGIINTVLTIAGLVGIGYGICAHSRLSKVCKRLDVSINEISDNVNVDISEEMVKKAVSEAVELQSRKAVEKAVNEAVAFAKTDIKKDVRSAVDRAYADIREKVLEETIESASKIDVDRVRKDIENSAKEKALKKFDDGLDDIFKSFKVYRTMEEVIPKCYSMGKEFVVKFN